MSITLTIEADTSEEFIEKFGIICTQFLVAKSTNTPQPVAEASSEPEAEKPKRKSRAKKAEKTEEKPEPETVAANDADDGTDADKEPELKLDDVRKELLSLMEMDQVKGPEMALAIFAEMDAKNISDVSPDRWPELVEKLEAAKVEIEKA